MQIVLDWVLPVKEKQWESTFAWFSLISSMQNLVILPTCTLYNLKVTKLVSNQNPTLIIFPNDHQSKIY